MMRKLGWLALVVALLVPAATAWAGDGKAGASCCCCCAGCPK